MRTHIALAVLALSFVLGCNALPGTGDAGDTSTCADGGTFVNDDGGVQGWCDACEACLAQPGMNWTAETCASSCMADTYCYGPGNPSAPTCPETRPEPVCGLCEDE